MLNIEGLGLDLWTSAQPFLERWMDEQVGWRALLGQLRTEAPRYAKLLPELPRLLHEALARQARDRQPSHDALIAQVLLERRRLRLQMSALGWGGGVRGRSRTNALYG